jgi:hypothetical protein
VESPSAISFAEASESVTDQGSGSSLSIWNSIGRGAALSIAALMPAV